MVGIIFRNRKSCSSFWVGQLFLFQACFRKNVLKTDYLPGGHKKIAGINLLPYLCA
jgi:hypothetical protein